MVLSVARKLKGYEAGRSEGLPDRIRNLGNSYLQTCNEYFIVKPFSYFGIRVILFGSNAHEDPKEYSDNKAF